MDIVGIRANLPAGVFGAMLGDVNAGRLPRAAISGVVPPAQMNAFVKNTDKASPGVAVANKAPTSAMMQKGSAQAATSVNPNVVMAKPPASGGVEVMPVIRALPLQTTPDRIEFGSLMLGQAQSKTIRFASPLNGELRVGISDPAFRIRWLRSLTGTFSLQTTPVTLPSGVSLQTVRAVPNVSQSRTAAPWSIPVKAGEDVEIIVDVSRSPSVTLGEHASQLKIDLTNSLGATVPVHARLDGRLYGIGINMDGEFRVLPGRDFLLPFEWVNEGEPGEATITLDNPAAGITTQTPTQTVKLGKGERKQGAFVINVSNITQQPNYAFSTLNLKVVNGPVRLNYAISIVVYPPWLMRSVVGRSRFNDGEEITVYGSMQIRSDGWFQFDGKITSSALGGLIATNIYRYDVGISLPGGFNHTVHGSFGKGGFGSTGSREDKWSESGMNINLANSFIPAASGLQAAVMNPYIKVTRSTF
jgi:hypothetical protein